MLAAAAFRLAVIEALCPTAAVNSGEGFPTMALYRVYDSRAISSADLDAGATFTPSLSVYTEDTRVERRGDAQAPAAGFALTDLVIIAELSELARDENGAVITEPGGGPVTDAVINGDAKMQIMLAALTAQVRAVIVQKPAGAPVRKIMKSVRDVRIEPFGLPQYGVRFLRNVMTFTVEIGDDRFTDAAGLPEPIRSVAEELPEGSYAKGRLAELAQAFAATTRAQIEGFTVRFDADGKPAMPFGEQET
ncbi:hypothetical protein GCM10007301_15470 [Azorhizobium oxalatiphilum]|uniref:Uncharacterized protein n=1 Tax=Azorhizobium oxalatiphilum TaxID=980631 RepID=A0A917F6X2_9HYPH|nr:hypothetical protein [Azorhizobium oxalatiphilum]GGF56690.1 hypothetical protein GCM10007301_15470 [Azorhizobium oxalatiphilum]